MIGIQYYSAAQSAHLATFVDAGHWRAQRFVIPPLFSCVGSNPAIHTKRKRKRK